MENFKKAAEFIIANSNICPTNLQDIQIKADEKTREEFGIEEPIHLWESYCIGDAEEEKLLANHLEYDSLDELFSAMDSYYEQVSEELYEEFVDAHYLYTLSINDFKQIECESLEDFVENAPIGTCWADKENCYFRKIEFKDSIVVWYVNKEGNIKVL